MNSLIRFFYTKFKRRHPFLNLCFNVLFAGGLLFGLIHIFSEDRMGILGNLLASIVGILISFQLFYVIEVLKARYEDVLKVNYDDKQQSQQYKNNYLQIFQFGDRSFRVYCEGLFFNTPDSKWAIDDHPNKFFELDSFIKYHAFELMSAHNASNTEHSTTVRLADCCKKDGVTTFVTERSTYLNHLLTNRVIDYKIHNEFSLRDLYENQATLVPLARSKMSNHIGINCLVFILDTEGSDNGQYLLLPERSKNATIAKNKLTASVAIRLKMEDYSQPLTAEMLEHGWIDQELYKSIMVSPSWIEKLKKEGKYTQQFLGASRDIYEAGKPTFSFFITLKTNISEYMEEYEAYKNCDDYKRYRKRGKLIDSADRIHIVKWNTLSMEPRGKRDRLVFEELKKCWNGITTRESKYSCEKNLIANFWFYRKYLDNK